MAELKIGQVAARVGVGIDTIRYYEKLGLLPVALRRRSGYRIFDETTVERVKLIKQLQDMGLHLQEIDAMLRAVGDHSTTCEHEVMKIRAALTRTEEKLAVLTMTRDKLTHALGRCSRGECTIVDQVARVTGASKPRSAGRRRTRSETGLG